MRHATLPLLLLLSGCDGCQPTEDLPDVVEAIPNTPAALWVGQGSGVGGGGGGGTATRGQEQAKGAEQVEGHQVESFMNSNIITFNMITL